MNKDTREKFMQASFNIGIQLCKDAIWHGKKCNWLGNIENDWGKTFFGALKPNLYNGTSGVSYFLSNLYKATGEDIFKNTALGAINTTKSNMASISKKLQNSFYSGLPGIAYSMIIAGENFEIENLIKKGLDCIYKLRSDNDEIDVINGVAGIIPLYILIGTKFSNSFLEKAIFYGDMLLSKSIESDYGLSWVTVPNNKVKANLTGYAHGVSGIAAALLDLYKLTNRPKYLNTARQAFDYEDHFYNFAENNWEDLRKGSDLNKIQFSVAWCHGAPGISLARSKAYSITKDEKFKVDAYLGIGKTIEFMKNSAYNYSICHGHLGNADVLITCSEFLFDSTLLTPAIDVAKKGILHFEKYGKWSSGLKDQEESLGYMLGNSGIGNFYLRLGAFEKLTVPTALIINP